MVNESALVVVVRADRVLYVHPKCAAIRSSDARRAGDMPRALHAGLSVRPLADGATVRRPGGFAPGGRG